VLTIDATLTPEEIARLGAVDPGAWFTQVKFNNAMTPSHPHGTVLESNNRYKQLQIDDLMQRVVPGRRVLDTFCANGVFSFRAAQLGAVSVVGVDFEQSRVDAGVLVADLARTHGQSWDVEFEGLDMYNVGSRFHGTTFDVVLCLGGLYHVADPPFILSQLRKLTEEWLIVQTSNVLPLPGRIARFKVRNDMTAEGLSSVRGGQGAWSFSASTFREMLRHAAFEVVEEHQPPFAKRIRFPWYCALARPIR
jgi:tRNA (mo5U34)-methyltransferase